MSILALALPPLTGYLVTYLTIRKTSLPNPSLLGLSLAFPLGWGVLSLLTFLSYLAAGRYGFHLAASLDLLLVCYLGLQLDIKSLASKIFQRPVLPAAAGSKALAAFLALAVFFYLAYFASKASGNILGGWDARYFWDMKARFYFREPLLWKGMFSPLLADWGHPDYPLMLPGAVAWGWLSLGKEFLFWPFAVALSFGLSFAALIFWYLFSYASFPAACLGAGYLLTIPMFHFWSTAQYADVPLAGFMTAAGVLLVAGLRKPDPRIFSFAGFLAGLCVWTKDEGYFFILWMGLTLLAALLTDHSKSTRSRMTLAAVFAAGAFFPIAASLGIKLFLGTTGGQYAGSGRSATDFMHLLFGSPQKTQILTAVFFLFWGNYEQWNGLWILFAAAAVFTGRSLFRDFRWIPAALVLLLHAGYFAILHVTPHDLKFQIETALLRIMSHAMGLAVIFILESFFHDRKA